MKKTLIYSLHLLEVIASLCLVMTVTKSVVLKVLHQSLQRRSSIYVYYNIQTFYGF